MSMLKEKVIEALKRAGVPSMQGCSFDFGISEQNDKAALDVHSKRNLGSLFANELVR